MFGWKATQASFVPTQRARANRRDGVGGDGSRNLGSESSGGAGRPQRDHHVGTVNKRLIHDAIRSVSSISFAFSPRPHRCELDGQSDPLKSHRRALRDAESSAEIEIAFRGNRRSASSRPIDVATGERDAGARHQRLQQHVAGARRESGSPCRRMESGLDQRPARLDAARDVVTERTCRTERDHAAFGSVLYCSFNGCCNARSSSRFIWFQSLYK